MVDVIETEWIPLPDGTELAARIWLPDGARDTPAPAILEYLPYRRRDGTARRDESVYPALAERGYAGVRVDRRGTGDSGGAFDDEYSEEELTDGEAVIAWIAAQPWCSGAVGMMGISWGGFNALQLAARRPPALKAVISIASTVDRFADDIHQKGGAQMGANLYWATQMLARASLPPDRAVVGDDWETMWRERLESVPALIFPWLAHQRRDDFWRHGSICEDFGAVEAPALMIAGWADGYRNTPWEARAGLGNMARALTGPWVHLYPHFASPAPRVDYIAETDRWFGRWLKDGDTGAEALPAHRLFVSEGVRPDRPRGREAGRWVAIGQGDASERVLHLSAAGLGDEAGSGTVQVRSPLDCGVDGGSYFTQGGDADLPGDQRGDDGLSVCFETGVLEEPLEIIGRPVLRVPVALDAPQGNLVARLMDVHPDGTAHRISLGVLNLSHRGGPAEQRLMVPGVAEDVALELDVTAYRLRAGHRLRLAVSTSYFPMILPPPTDVTATITLDQAALHLPFCETEDIILPEPEGGLPDYPRASPAEARRSVTRDRVSGRVAVELQSTGGRLTHPEHGMEWEDAHHSTWAITRGDAESLEGDERVETYRVRDGVEARIIATGKLRATEAEWIVEATLTATLNGEEVAHRTWQDRIRRDHV